MLVDPLPRHLPSTPKIRRSRKFRAGADRKIDRAVLLLRDNAFSVNGTRNLAVESWWFLG